MKKKVSQTVNDKSVQNEDNHALKDFTNRLKLSEDSKKELAQKLKFSEESKTKMKRYHKEAMEEVGRMNKEIEKFKTEIKTFSE